MYGDSSGGGERRGSLMKGRKASAQPLVGDPTMIFLGRRGSLQPFLHRHDANGREHALFYANQQDNEWAGLGSDANTSCVGDAKSTEEGTDVAHVDFLLSVGRFSSWTSLAHL